MLIKMYFGKSNRSNLKAESRDECTMLRLLEDYSCISVFNVLKRECSVTVLLCHTRNHEAFCPVLSP